ncbi:hypothetical protein [Bradyrhizobium sp. NBAIM01]|nr:hypothetical protein [Bradyrhizobium sp. NBAIM01]MCA1512216.1 hypothetical protein [Bradyrhizobium sp. NBAIM01]
MPGVTGLQPDWSIREWLLPQTMRAKKRGARRPNALHQRIDESTLNRALP